MSCQRTPGLVAGSIAVTELVSLIWAFWSFKMGDSLFGATKGGGGFTKHTEVNGSGLWQKIIGSGVCPLGKLGAWSILIWAIALTALIAAAVALDKNWFFALAIVHAALVSVVFGISLTMNKPLFVRTLPYFALQAAVAVQLFGEHEAMNCEDGAQ